MACCIKTTLRQPSKTCSRRNKKMFANNFEKVREQFAKSSRTFFSFFANTVLSLFEPPEGTGIKQLLSRGPQTLTSTKCTFVPHNMYFCTPRNVLSCSTGPTTVFDGSYTRAPRVLLPCPTSPTPVPYGSDTRAPRVRHLCPTGPTLVPHDRYFIILCKLCACVSCCFSGSFGSFKKYIRLEENL